ncbi:DUF1453 domain-containing protein [Rhodanobacter sp. FDAARGOS 1247]|uniref:DUF1453 domain-containing protein n=1 Tax=Rhodanobacter sp. FDAARGOS 1247 TaxID=2778082 RepID=UPI00194F1A4A|nr:DUF1453 domain-containing protein [Rhodanobacter sp. FDAARGOS 1247]QRP63737.1 DUF1453 domain-containing protein [Rhodanobacter sp. FDAARGOS 1247]
MPLHMTSYLIMLPVLAWMVWKRVSRQFGRQPIRRKRMIARIVIFVILGGLMALSGLQRLALAEGLLGGVLIGGAVGLVGLRLTRFEIDPVKGDCYVPNPWIGALLTALLLGRLAWRLFETWQMQATAGGAAAMQPMGHALTPLTLLVIGLLVGYYIVYFTGLLIHHRRFQRSHPGIATSL